MKLSRPPAVALAILAACGLAGSLLSGCAASPAHRYFQPTVDQLGPYPNSYGQAVIPRHGLIVVQGDDFAYGSARGRSRYRINGADEGQAAITLSQTLRRVIKGVRVENRGFPGDTVASSEERWGDAPPGDLTILSFSYGDAAAHTTLADFMEQLSALIKLDQASGGVVFVVLPPPNADPLREAALAPYRVALNVEARSAGAEVFDSLASLTRLKLQPVKTAAQPAIVYQAVGADLVPYIKVIEGPATSAPGASAHVGQAGSADSRTVRASAASAS